MYLNAKSPLVGLTIIGVIFVSLVRPEASSLDNTGDDLKKDDLAQCQLREKDLETLMQDKIDLLTEKLKNAELVSQRLERQLSDSAGSDASSAEEELREKLTNCGETVKAIRERHDSDQAAFKQLTKEHAQLSKTSGNCTEKLKECETQKSYLEFLKKGYDVVVQDLEKETKVAKENKEKSDKDAKDAIKGASKYRTYLVAIGIVVVILVSIKVYYIAHSTLQQRTKKILEAKARDKSLQKKTKRK